MNGKILNLARMPELPEIPQRLALYARVSTEEQREGQTIDSQLSELERFSREKGWPVAGIYKDDGWSGGVMERPELDRLRDDAQKGIFGAVLINDVDRLARDVAHLGIIKRDLERKGIRVIFRKLPSETSPTYNLMINILGSFAEFERELIADRTRRGRRHKIEIRKLYLGSNTAYGYRYISADKLAGKSGYLEVLPHEARVVQQMFEWVDVEGLSARRVMKRLNDLRIPPRKGGHSWMKTSVLRVLHCQTYAGTWHYNKYQSIEPAQQPKEGRYRKRTKCSLRQRPRTEWIPLELPDNLRLVSPDRWQRVQQQIQRNVVFSPRNEKHRYLLKGLVRCGACQSVYVGEPSHGKFGYRCGKRCKQLPTIGEPLLNEAVKEAVREVLTNPAVILEPLRELEEAQARKDQQHPIDRQKVENALQQLAVEEERVLDAYRTGVLTPKQLSDQLQLLKSRRASLEAKHAEIVRSAASVPMANARTAVVDYCVEAEKNLDRFTDEEWRELLRTVVSHIVFQGKHVVIVGRIPVPELGSASQFRVSQVVPFKGMICESDKVPRGRDADSPVELRGSDPS